MKEIEQIHYTSWYNELSPAHAGYFSDIGDIAAWIGYALIGGIHGSHVDLIRSNTIHVSQTKEKFGEVRVYCYLASYEQVEKWYKKEIKMINENNDKYIDWKYGKMDPDDKEYPKPWIIKMYEEKYPLRAPTLEEYHLKRYLEDAQWYRHIYLNALQLFPHYRWSILNSSDYPEFLFQTQKKLDEYFDNRIDNISTYSIDESVKVDRVNQLIEANKLAIEVCQFKEKDNEDN